MAQKKPAPKKDTRRPKTAEGTQRARLKAKLAEAIDLIDEEGLLFLLRQAAVLIHNQRVDELNQELAELPSKPARSGRSRAAPSARTAVEVEDDGTRPAIFLTLGTVRKVLDREELKRLVRICYAAESKTNALRQLYTVLARERSDILNDAGIASPGSPLVEGLFHALRERYHLEDR